MKREKEKEKRGRGTLNRQIAVAMGTSKLHPSCQNFISSGSFAIGEMREVSENAIQILRYITKTNIQYSLV